MGNGLPTICAASALACGTPPPTPPYVPRFNQPLPPSSNAKHFSDVDGVAPSTMENSSAVEQLLTARLPTGGHLQEVVWS